MSIDHTHTQEYFGITPATEQVQHMTGADHDYISATHFKSKNYAECIQVHFDMHKRSRPAVEEVKCSECSALPGLPHLAACTVGQRAKRDAERRSQDRRTDAVNHPQHYNQHPSGVECIDVIEHMTLNVGNCVKYLWRAGLKDSAPEIEDLKKARWYIDREISRLEKADGSIRD